MGKAKTKPALDEQPNLNALSTACIDWRERIVAGKSLVPLPPLYPVAAAEGLSYFDSLVVADAGMKTMGDISGDWIRDFAGALFGSYDETTGIRHITEYFMLISKKNGKSTDAGAIMLTVLLLNWRPSAEFLILAPTIEVANNAFGPVRDMIRNDEELSEMLQVQEHTRTVTHLETKATLKVVAADSDTVSGKKATGVLVDELWLFGKKVNADNMLKEACGGLVSRPEGFVIYLSTQSDEPPAGVFKAKLDYARDVRDGKIHDPKFMPIIYEFPEEMIESEAYKLPENFFITNPNMGRSVSKEWLIREREKCEREGPESERVFYAKHLNVELGMNLRNDRWRGADHWEFGKHKTHFGLDWLLSRAEVVTVGLDGGGLDDLLGLAVLGRERADLARLEERDQRWYLWCKGYCHEKVLELRKDIASQLMDYEADGDLMIVEVVGYDTDDVGEIVGKIFRSGLLYKVGMDPASIGGILDAILSNGVPEDTMVSVNQGWRLAGSIKTTERKLPEGVLVHAGQPLMAWCVGNAKVQVKGNAIVVTKQMSGLAKIDPLMAAFNAVALMSLNPPAQYEIVDVSNMIMG